VGNGVNNIGVNGLIVGITNDSVDVGLITKVLMGVVAALTTVSVGRIITVSVGRIITVSVGRITVVSVGGTATVSVGGSGCASEVAVSTGTITCAVAVGLVCVVVFEEPFATGVVVANIGATASGVIEVPWGESLLTIVAATAVSIADCAAEVAINAVATWVSMRSC
jgi:hypothetical protein